MLNREWNADVRIRCGLPGEFGLPSPPRRNTGYLDYGFDAEYIPTGETKGVFATSLLTQHVAKLVSDQFTSQFDYDVESSLWRFQAGSQNN
jgi:hypothetical protein